MSLGSAAHMMANRLRSLGRVPGATGGWPDVGHVVIAAAPLRRRLRFNVFTDPPLNLSERHRWLAINSKLADGVSDPEGPTGPGHSETSRRLYL